MGGRKSRYARRPEESALFRAALYIRLSREDGDREESDSVTNQRDMLTREAEADGTIASWEAFVDDGYSGTNFERPAFADMLEALRSGRLNCVLVKDLSRFGRNYIEVGRFLEQVFPLWRVRFVSVNDGIDSYRLPAQSNTILVPFKNLINDEYSRDISQKIRSALDTRRKNGEFIGAFACYGYEKDPERRGRLRVDPEAAQVVRDIYRMALGGIGKAAIARRLNERGVPNPTAYKRSRGLRFHAARGGGGRGLWTFSTVSRILQNRLYAGDMVQGRTGNVSYKLQKTRARAPEEWFVVENTHEPIVPRADWQRVQELLARDTRADGPGSGRPAGAAHPLSGFVYCGECGRALNRRRVRQPYGEYQYYYCPTYRVSKTACSKHAVRVELVERAVLDAIRGQIRLAVSFDRLYDRLSTQKSHTARHADAEAAAARQSALGRIMALKQSAYEDWKAGDLTREEYLSFKESYDAREAGLRRELEALAARASEDPPPRDPWIARLRALEDPRELTRELVCALVESVRVHEDGRIVITFTFSEAMASMADFLGERGASAAPADPAV